MKAFAASFDARSFRAAVWAAGLTALLAGCLAWLVSAQPYQAPWAWVSFIGMCVVEDYLGGSDADAGWGQPPKLTLFAAIIVFRRHPEITMLVALVSAPLASVLKGQRWSTQVTATAQWLLAAVAGAAAFRAVGFEDTTQFVAATGVLMLVYYLTGPVLSAWIERNLSGGSFPEAFRDRRRFAISLQAAGILLAMAWRTAAFQPAALKLADGALVGVAGIAIGFLLAGRPAWLFRGSARVPQRGAIAGGLVLVAGLVSPAPLSWLLPLGLGVAAAVWSIPRQAYPVLCCALGAVCNETVRAVNNGYMPVEGSGLMSGLGAANTYVTAGPQTALAFLDDRFALPPPFPGIASAGDILIAIGMAWLVAAVIARHRQATAASDADVEDLPLEAAA